MATSSPDQRPALFGMATLPTHLPTDVPWTHWTGRLPPATTAVIRYFIVPSDQPFLTALLSPDEQQRANRFRQSADKQCFVAGRGWLRWMAGQLTGTLPDRVQLATGPFGKPELVGSNPETVSWHVNVSHAGEWVLLAVGPRPVGVDVEWIKPNWAYEELIPSTFDADDQEQLSISPDARTLFYTFWTRKESLLKATGQGLINDLTTISSSKEKYQAVHAGSAETATWQATSFWVSAGYVGSLAWQEPLTPVQFFTAEMPGGALAV